MLIPTSRPQAIARISGRAGLTGTVTFYPMWDGTLVVAQLRGLPQGGDGIFGMHIHEGSRCTGPEFADTGGHFDPYREPHPRHAGDLPPVFRCCGGRGYLAVATDRFSVQNVIGRTVVIHSGADDFRTQPAGNAGTKIACGVIRRL